jgi:glycosyltransferase involved in cell wall biosynthesis
MVEGYRLRIAVVFSVPAGAGGLGQHTASALHALSAGNDVHAFGPVPVEPWPLPGGVPPVQWHPPPSENAISRWKNNSIWNRWRSGSLQLARDRALGKWAADEVRRLSPDLCYVFTQVGLETLRWAEKARIPALLESPNGHLRNFWHVYKSETERWGGAAFHGHPTAAMVERVEEEYALAYRMRVSSQWSRLSMMRYGVDGTKTSVLQQPVNLSRFSPERNSGPHQGPLRVCFVGSLDLRKGFVYLLQAIRRVGPDRISLEIVGATGDRLCKKLFARERKGLNVHCAPGDPIPALQRAELFVLPTLEDGSPFAVAEAMASGLPVTVTDSCGAAEWVRHRQSGWIVAHRSVDALAEALDDALAGRDELQAMGLLARADTEKRASLECLQPFSEWVEAVGVQFPPKRGSLAAEASSRKITASLPDGCD